MVVFEKNTVGDHTLASFFLFFIMNGTTPGTHLGNTPLNLAKLRELSRKELPEILDKVISV
jgi:hypothetical protein